MKVKQVFFFVCLKENATNGRNFLLMLTFVCCLFLPLLLLAISLSSPSPMKLSLKLVSMTVVTARP